MSLRLEQAGTLSVADVLHHRFSTLPGDATLDEVRAWFAVSPHRRMAFLATDGRYVGSLTREAVDAEIDGSQPAAGIASEGPTVAPSAPANLGHSLAIASEARRVPVVDEGGRLLGVVAVTEDLSAFCGAS